MNNESDEFEFEYESDGDPVNERDWADKYHEELAELYRIYLDTGQKIFGLAFHQYGDFVDFARFVRRFTII